MKLVITIDTEEDNWGEYIPTGWSVSNIEKIPELQQIFDDFGVTPTYLITYPVASDEQTISILREILDAGRCEIGTHCHPWNTPPFEGENTEKNSMLCNLPPSLQLKKIEYLHQTIQKNFNITPISFRAGKYGYGKEVAANLHKLGYKIDTSITPYTDWKGENGSDFSDISPEPFISDRILEIPVSIGFLQQNFELCNTILNILRKKSLSSLRLIGIMAKLGLLNRVSLSPEVYDSKEMIKLTHVFMNKGYKLINMEFHSTTLKYGMSPYTPTREDKQIFIQRIKEFLTFTRYAGIESIRLSDCINLLDTEIGKACLDKMINA